MPAWPSTLPDFVLREGYEEGFKDLVVRTQMSTGAAKRRRRFSDGPEPYKFPIEFTSDELDIFKEFYEDPTTGLAGGALSFTKPHPRTGATETWAFISAISPAQSAGHDSFIVTLDLEQLQ